MSDKILEEVLQRFAAADCSWLTTVRPDARPHSAPIWHVLYKGYIYVISKPTAVRVANIQHNPRVTITHPDPHSAIIIDGRAQIGENMASQLRPYFQEKYDWDIATDGDYTTIIEICPSKIMAWGAEEGAGKRKRWRVVEGEWSTV
jgi:general stress protein 26